MFFLPGEDRIIIQIALSVIPCVNLHGALSINHIANVSVIPSAVVNVDLPGALPVEPILKQPIRHFARIAHADVVLVDCLRDELRAKR